MQIKRQQRNIFQITLTGYELATLISSARWIVEGAKGDLPKEAISNLESLLSNYDKASEKLFGNPSS